MIIANRTKEIQLFQQMIQGSFFKRVLMIEAKSGFGKTWLLTQFNRTLPTNTLSVLIDLKSAQTGIPYIFYSVRKRLGQKHFPQLNAAVQRYLSAGIEISDTKMIGQDQHFSVVLMDVDENTRNFRLIELQDALFRDLRAIRQKIVFLFDSYEKAPNELANWLGGGFLTDVVDIDKLIVVIAGQQVPEPTLEWMEWHHCCHLEAILDRDAWYNYTQNKKLPLNKDHVWAVMNTLKGHPANIEKALATLAKEEQ